jgi:hypothetical protein
MNPIQRAARLRQEADRVLQEVGVPQILLPYGRVVPTGSYFLDVMVYPDVDLYLSKVSIEQLFQIGGKVAQSARVVQVVFERSRTPQLPGGLYLKARVGYGDWGRPWKIDIWSLDEALIEETMRPMHVFKARMTPSLREQIIRYKVSVLTAQHRTPMYSGYYIYKAFIEKGLSQPDEVTQYLVEHGIRMQ